MAKTAFLQKLVRLKQGKLNIFISYSRRDSAIADTLVDALAARGFAVTSIDRRHLEFGEKWQAELAEDSYVRRTPSFGLSAKTRSNPIG